MIDSADKINDLAARAKAKKTKQWETIRTDAPEIAGLIIALTKRFGKPEGLRVESSGQVIIDTLPACRHRRGVKP